MYNSTKVRLIPYNQYSVLATTRFLRRYSTDGIVKSKYKSGNTHGNSQHYLGYSRLRTATIYTITQGVWWCLAVNR